MSDFPINLDTRDSESNDDDELSGAPPAWRDGGDDDPDPPALGVPQTTDSPETPDFPVGEEEQLVVA